MAGFQDKEIARLAGVKSKRGKSRKTEAWEKLGESILSYQAEKVNKELSKLSGMDFINAYTSLVKYWKPTLRSMEIDVREYEPLTVYEPDKELTGMTNDQLIDELKLLENEE